MASADDRARYSGEIRVLSERIATIEVRQKTVENLMMENRNATANELRTLKEDVKDQIDDVVRAQTKADYELEQSVEKLNVSMGVVNETLQSIKLSTLEAFGKINTKLALHAFIFSVLGLLGMGIFTAYTKSSFDQLNKNATQIYQLQRLQLEELQSRIPQKQSP